MSLHEDAIDALSKTSRTFFLPIVRLPSGLREAVMSAYLCLRALDEIEDHAQLGKFTKIQILQEISLNCQMSDEGAAPSLSGTLYSHRHALPEVTNRISDWITLAPEAIAARIRDMNSATAQRMAHWVSNGWQVSADELT
jgi:farnesyl-diphosphate farnesyltransferase